MKAVWFLYLFLAGGLTYQLTEMSWRGYTHFSMFILGGTCVCAVNLLYSLPVFQKHVLLLCIVGGVCVTVFEFITGLIVNKGMGLCVWDYSDMPFNLLGQICLPYSCAWTLLVIPATGLGTVIKGIVYSRVGG